MISFPRAKINIGLRVIRKRSDGFHDIETLFYPVPLYDALEFIVAPDSPGDDLLVTSGIDIETNIQNNMVIRAVRSLRENFIFPFLKIHLHKVIPSGAGLGGGSSDASCMLTALNKYFRLSLQESYLQKLALDLGSDCPFFINAVPSIASGRGEKLKPVKAVLDGYNAVLINPGIRISTRDAYINCHPSSREDDLEELVSSDIKSWKKNVRNDFEDFAFRIHPQIKEIKASLYRTGAIFSSMSGSGSTVYGIFEGKPVISRKLQNYVIWKGKL